MSALAPLSVTLRAMQLDDLAALADMWIASWRDVFSEIDFEARRAWFCERILAHRRDGVRIIVAENEAQLLGFVTVDTTTRFIDQLAVAPFAMGCGVGQRLIAQARRVSPRQLLLDVNEDNRRALNFYRRQGFRVVGEGVSETSGLPLLRMAWAP